MNEQQYQAALIKAMQDDFELYTGPDGKGVWGHSMRNTRERVKIDVVARAKTHVLEMGFVNAPFGIEVKAPKDGRKVFDMAFQCLDYRFSEFKFQSGYKPLAFILAYPRLCVFDKQHGRTLERFLTRFQVGWIELDKHGWKIEASAGQAYARRYKDSLRFTSQKNYPLVTARYGNYTASRQRRSHGG
jgi:hypothetical protein